MRKIWMRNYRDLRDNAQPLVFIAAYIVFMNSFLHVSVCPFRGITGLPCPACGMTRAGLLFLRGDFQGAFQIHPFFFGVLLLAGIAILFRYVLGREIRWMQYPLMILGIGMLIYYIYRMKTYFPNVEPMLYEERSLFGILGVAERLGMH